MIRCYGKASEAVGARNSGTWKNFTELSDVLVVKQGLSLKQQKIYQCCVEPVLLKCCEKTYCYE